MGVVAVVQIPSANMQTTVDPFGALIVGAVLIVPVGPEPIKLDSACQEMLPTEVGPLYTEAVIEVHQGLVKVQSQEAGSAPVTIRV